MWCAILYIITLILIDFEILITLCIFYFIIILKIKFTKKNILGYISRIYKKIIIVNLILLTFILI